MEICRLCGTAFTARAWQVAKSDYECRPCLCARRKAYRLQRIADGKPLAVQKADPAYNRAYLAQYYADPEKRALRAKRMRAYRSSDDEHAHRHRVRAKVSKAVKTGKLTRLPCEVCGASKTEAHHDDYSQPLNVRWLCPSHHREHHAGHGAAK